MLFFPLTESTHYSSGYCSKIMFNHDKFNGEEATVCIGGLKNLKTPIKIKKWLNCNLASFIKRFPSVSENVEILPISTY